MNDSPIFNSLLKLVLWCGLALLIVAPFAFAIWIADGTDEVEEDMKRSSYMQDHPEAYVKQYFKDHPNQPFIEAKHYLDSIEEDSLVRQSQRFDSLLAALRAERDSIQASH